MLLALLVIALALLVSPVSAFGAGELSTVQSRVMLNAQGNIPSYSYLEDKAFRHGDIEDVIAKL